MTRKQLVLLISALFSSVAASAASAQSNDGTAARSSCWGGPFGGAYIGANAGFASSDADQLTNGLEVGGSDEGFTGGGQAGYNLQCDRILFGIEADFNYLDLDASASYPGPIFVNAKLDWFSTVRGRLGLVHNDKFLVYATGGVAFAKADHVLYDPAFAFVQSDDDERIGWTAGGGIEWLRDSRWTVRAEGLYADLGTERHDYRIVVCGLACNSRTDWDDSFWVVRLGLNYRFGAREPEAAPLK